MTKVGYLMFVATLTSSLLLWAPSIYGQSDPAAEAFNRGQALYKVGKYDCEDPFSGRSPVLRCFASSLPWVV